MPIWDRDYMREPRPEPGPLQTVGALSVTTKLVIVNAVAFLLQVMSDRTELGVWMVQWLYNHPDGVLERYYLWQPLTSAFLHADFMHILFNMLFLWWFGRELEQIYGRRDFLWFYLLACYVGGMAYAVGGLLHTGLNPSIGASSGVMGVVVLYAFFFPNRQIWIYFLFPVKIWMVAVVYVAGDVLGFLGGGGGVANAAHLGGAAVGVLFRFYDLRWTTLTRRLTGRRRPRRGRYRDEAPRIIPLRRREPEPEPEGRLPNDEDRRMDALLERIKRDGMESLSAEEKTFLEEMSRKLRTRR